MLATPLTQRDLESFPFYDYRVASGDRDAPEYSCQRFEMNVITMRLLTRCFCALPWLAALASLLACRQSAGDVLRERAKPAAADTSSVPESVSMGGTKSVTKFFVTSVGLGKGGDLGGLASADAHCQALADAEGAGDHTWRAYLSASATSTGPAVHARDRIGSGPWYNAEGLLVAGNVADLHGEKSRLNKDTAVTERLDTVNGAGDTPNRHDMLTGSRTDGTAFDAGEDRTCRNWTSGTTDRAQVGHHDRSGPDGASSSWNSAHASSGCSQSDLGRTGGSGLFYCFAID